VDKDAFDAVFASPDNNGPPLATSYGKMPDDALGTETPEQGETAATQELALPNLDVPAASDFIRRK
jgi:hypothetical protein